MKDENSFSDEMHKVYYPPTKSEQEKGLKPNCEYPQNHPMRLPYGVGDVRSYGVKGDKS